MMTRGHLLHWIVLCLLGIGVVMVHSAGVSIGGEGLTVRSMLGGRTLLYAGLALAMMALIGFVDVRRLGEGRGWFNPVLWLLAGSVALCGLALVPGMGRSVNDSSRWLYLGPQSWNLSFQPSELAKWSMVLAAAWYGAKQSVWARGFWWKYILAVLVLGAVCGLIAKEDLGTGALIGVVGLGILAAAGARWWLTSLATVVGAAGGVMFILAEEYRIRRITSFTDPWADPEHSGFHLVQSLNTIVEGGLFGRGLGNGVGKFDYVPEDTTDFIFAVICGELGIAGAAMVAGLYLGLLWMGLAIIREHKHTFGRLLGLGVLLTIGLQAIINLLVVTGLAPTKGIALPLISSGGTGWILTAMSVGTLVALDRINRMEVEDERVAMTVDEASDSVAYSAG